MDYPGYSYDTSDNQNFFESLLFSFSDDEKSNTKNLSSIDNIFQDKELSFLGKKREKVSFEDESKMIQKSPQNEYINISLKENDNIINKQHFSNIDGKEEEEEEEKEKEKNKIFFLNVSKVNATKENDIKLPNNHNINNCSTEKETPTKNSKIEKKEKKDKFNVNVKDTQGKKFNLTEKESQRKDNFSQKLFPKINNRNIAKIETEIEKCLKKEIKLYTPIYDIFSHNTNSINIYFFLDIQFENIITMTKEIYEALEKLLIDMKIKKIIKRKEAVLTKDTKEYKKAIEILKIYNYIKENDNKELNIEQVKNNIIKILKNEGLKNSNEKLLYKADKDNLDKLLIKNGKKKPRYNQEKNKDNLKEIKQSINIKKLMEIKGLKMTYCELIIEFFNCDEFENFSEEVKSINEEFKKAKKNKYSLLDKYNNENINGFIRMIKEDCGLSNEQKLKINHLTTYFKNRNLNLEEIEIYRKKYVFK